MKPPCRCTVTSRQLVPSRILCEQLMRYGWDRKTFFVYRRIWVKSVLMRYDSFALDFFADPRTSAPTVAEIALDLLERGWISDFITEDVASPDTMAACWIGFAERARLRTDSNGR